MKLGMPEDSLPVQEMFERFFATEATSARVRSAEPVGFDPALWSELVGLEAPLMRLSADAGGGGMSLFDACLMMEQAGRRLAPAPLAESVVAVRVLGEIGGEVAREWIEKVRAGDTVLTLALHRGQARPDAAGPRRRRGARDPDLRRPRTGDRGPRRSAERSRDPRRRGDRRFHARPGRTPGDLQQRRRRTDLGRRDRGVEDAHRLGPDRPDAGSAEHGVRPTPASGSPSASRSAPTRASPTRWPST